MSWARFPVPVGTAFETDRAARSLDSHDRHTFRNPVKILRTYLSDTVIRICYEILILISTTTKKMKKSRSTMGFIGYCIRIIITRCA